MNKLYVLAERNILDYLHSIGVFPYMFFTDFDKFKVKSPFFEDAVVVVIFSGVCSFSKKVVCNSVTALESRVSDAKDGGILSVDVLSDCELFFLDKYYKYDEYPVEFTLYRRSKVANKNKLDFWSSLQYDKFDEPVEIYLDDFDYANAKERLKSKVVGTDTALRGIKIPTREYMSKDGK